MRTPKEKLIEWVDAVVEVAHGTSQAKGFYDNPNQNAGEKIALMHSELSEMLEEVRRAEPQMSEKIPEFTAEEEEAVDVLIRMFDYSGWRNLRLGAALVAKLDYNASRPYKHGKSF